MLSPIYFLHIGLLLACMLLMAVYLLQSKRNAFGDELVGDQRLRRTAGQMIMAETMVYIANTPLVTMMEDVVMAHMLSLTIDLLVSFPFQFRFMLSLLQDRKRWSLHYIWLAAPAMIPIVGHLLEPSRAWLWGMYAYYICVFMVCVTRFLIGLRQYDRWLHDNYADLERKEARWTLVMLLFFVMMMMSYFPLWNPESYESIITESYFFHLMSLLFFGFVTWRIDQQQVLEGPDSHESIGNLSNLREPETSESGPDPLLSRMESMLRLYCVKKQLYLRHDLTLTELAKACGTNRTYLSRYFASQDITYNAYINRLRIDHFKRLYAEAAKTADGSLLDTTLQQLAADSGFRSYDTFTRAFRTYAGCSIRDWIK